MEVVEVVGNAGRTSGTVVEVVRPGYRLNGQLFRFAQVKVAR
jgi:molecular chaperone GrpE (heat shock protein)